MKKRLSRAPVSISGNGIASVKSEDIITSVSGVRQLDVLKQIKNSYRERVKISSGK